MNRGMNRLAQTNLCDPTDHFRFLKVTAERPLSPPVKSR